MRPAPDVTPSASDQLDPSTITVIAVLSGRWSIQVLQFLNRGHVRFNDLRRHLTGISHKVLIDTLRMLQREGFVEGPLTGDAPPRSYRDIVEYQLTAAGRDLLVLTADIQQWSLHYKATLDGARQSFAHRWSRLG